MYARVPDGYAFAAPVLAAGNAAVGALARMSAWAAGNASDGFVPDAVVRMIATTREINSLEASGLLDRVTAGEKRLSVQRVGGKDEVLVVFPADGVWLSDYLTWNLSAAEGHELSERGRKGGRASAAARAAHRGELQAQPQVELDVQPQVDMQSSSPVQSGPFQSEVETPSDELDDETWRTTGLLPVPPTAHEPIPEPLVPGLETPCEFDEREVEEIVEKAVP